MRVEIALCLPRDASSVGLVRDVALGALSKLKVDPADIDDIRLVLSEACTNVIEHSGTDDEYEVQLDITDELCEIRVIDTGRGWDFAEVERGMPSPISARGRGLAIIQAISDKAEFRSQPESGTMVRLVKTLHLEPGGPLDRLLHPPAV